ncbi:threonine synthase [Gammaproteobacteria bacterium]|nr:threonine synthase [Gammaproteobacteria bacterium]
MLFHSTRGGDSNKTFEEVLLQGLASDGGLFMPNEWPQVNLDNLKKQKTFLDVAKQIVPLYTSSSFQQSEVLELLDKTWHDFSDKNFAPIRSLDEEKSVLELFHGPTAAFKDFGLQLAAAFFNKTLKKNNKTAIVLGATSGDTGSAAIDACKRFDSIKSFILLPDRNMSDIQRRQMTTVKSDNVFTLLVDGSFDDCQDIVKQGFKERSFLKDNQYLLAVNSINWVRIIGQICYYFYATLVVNNFSKGINFSVPTGNFGNVFACYAASKMGMPLEKIIVAVNDNNILDRFFRNNDYSKKAVYETLSPSMDISIASNFERLIYDLYAERDSKICLKLYSAFPNTPIELEGKIWNKSKDIFLSHTVKNDETIAHMRYIKDKYNYLVDPHTAVGTSSVDSLNNKLKGHTLILSTAHPAKFPDVVKKAGLQLSEVPKNLLEAMEGKEYAVKMPASKDDIFKFIIKNN